MNLVETLIDHNDHRNVPFSNNKLQQAFSIVMVETEEEECDAERKANNVTMDTFIQSLVTTNKPRKKGNVANERRISSKILEEMLKGFKGLTLASTINDSAYYHSDKNDAKNDPKCDQLVATHTSEKRKEKSLIWTLPKEIIHTSD